MVHYRVGPRSGILPLLIYIYIYIYKLTDLHKEFICGMKDSFSSNITPRFLTLDLLFI